MAPVELLKSTWPSRRRAIRLRTDRPQFFNDKDEEIGSLCDMSSPEESIFVADVGAPHSRP